MENFQDSSTTSTSHSDYESCEFRAPAALGYSTIVRRKIFPMQTNVPQKQSMNYDCSTSAQSSSTMYSEINKKPKKRVCFWDDITTSTTTTTTTSSDDHDENSWTPSASPSKFPKTNPHFKLPPQKANYDPTAFANIRQLTNVHRPQSVMSTSSTFSTDVTNESDTNYSTTSYDTEVDRGTVANQAGRDLRRIVAGLKGFGIKGELYLNILLNRGLLTITIDEARNLIPPNGSNCCCSYVRVSLMPDEEKRTQCKTELVPQSNRPIFNQTFTIELLPEDYEKRLIISVWHRSSVAEKSIFLGCMSFTVKSLIETNKQIDGWYFLLSPQYGKRKHLAVHKVTMLTYYGSVDSGIQNGGDPCQDQRQDEHFDHFEKQTNSKLATNVSNHHSRPTVVSSASSSVCNLFGKKNLIVGQDQRLSTSKDLKQRGEAIGTFRRSNFSFKSSSTSNDDDEEILRGLKEYSKKKLKPTMSLCDDGGDNHRVQTTRNSFSPKITKFLNLNPLRKFSHGHSTTTIAVTQNGKDAVGVGVGAYANYHNLEPPSSHDEHRKLSAPDLDFRRSGVYLGDAVRDPVLDMLNKKNRAGSTTMCGDPTPTPVVVETKKKLSMSTTAVVENKKKISLPSVMRNNQPKPQKSSNTAVRRKSMVKAGNHQSFPVFSFDSPSTSSSRSDDDSNDCGGLFRFSPDVRRHSKHGVGVVRHRHHSLNADDHYTKRDRACSVDDLTDTIIVEQPLSLSDLVLTSTTLSDGPLSPPLSSRKTSQHFYQFLRRSRSLANGDVARVRDGSQGRHHTVAVDSVRSRKISQPAFTRTSCDEEILACTKKQANETKKKRSFAEPIAKKFNFLLRRPTDSFIMTHGHGKPSQEDIKIWSQSFDKLLRHKYGVMLFRLFLQREFSEENIEFWLACEEYKKLGNTKLLAKSKHIYNEYVAVQAPKEVNLDSVTRDVTVDSIHNPNKHTFDQAQHRIQSLMAKDSYPRFLRSDLYMELLQK